MYVEYVGCYLIFQQDFEFNEKIYWFSPKPRHLLALPLHIAAYIWTHIELIIFSQDIFPEYNRLYDGCC